MKVFYAERDGRHFYCRRQGSGPVLLMIHGAASNCRFFDGAARYLEEDYTVVTYDRFGYSQSRQGGELDGIPEEAFSVEEQAKDALAVLDAVDPNAKAYVAGHSAGSLVALELALRHPERVKALAVYEPPMAVGDEAVKRKDTWQTDLLEIRKTHRLVKALVYFAKSLGGFDEQTPDKSLQQQSENLKNLEPFLYKEMPDFLDYGSRLKTLLPLQMPLFYGAGTLDQTGIFSEHAEEAAEYLDCEFERMEGCHNFPEDRPERYACWLKQIFASSAAVSD